MLNIPLNINRLVVDFHELFNHQRTLGGNSLLETLLAKATEGGQDEFTPWIYGC